MPMKRTVRKRVSKALTKFVRGKNPTKRSTRRRVSRSLTKFVRNFTGTITRTGDGQVVIAGTGPKPKGARNPRKLSKVEVAETYGGYRVYVDGEPIGHRAMQKKEAQETAREIRRQDRRDRDMYGQL